MPTDGPGGRPTIEKTLDALRRLQRACQVVETISIDYDQTRHRPLARAAMVELSRQASELVEMLAPMTRASAATRLAVKSDSPGGLPVFHRRQAGDGDRDARAEQEPGDACAGEGELDPHRSAGPDRRVDRADDVLGLLKVQLELLAGVVQDGHEYSSAGRSAGAVNTGLLASTVEAHADGSAVPLRGVASAAGPGGPPRDAGPPGLWAPPGSV